MSKYLKNFLFWILILLGVFLFTQRFTSNPINGDVKEITFSEYVKDVTDNKVKSVQLSNGSHVINGIYKDNKKFKTVFPSGDIHVVWRLLERNVNVVVAESAYDWSGIVFQIFNILPFLVMIGLMIFATRKSSKGGLGGLGGGFGIGKNSAKTFKPNDKNKVTFKDVAGIDEAKQELEEVVEFLKSPVKFQRLGGRIPRGLLLVGDPGNGKTLLARAIAGEANVPFFSASGSNFVEMFVGVGASRVRELFENARKNSPCIIFIDEIDAVGRRRDSSFRTGNDEREQTLNQILVEMDGFEESNGVIVIAATNRADILDPALLRPGRFDRRITVNYPDMVGREMILKVHSKKVPLAPDVDLKTVARGTPGFSGAELANLVNEAALLAARQNKLAVNSSDFDKARDKIIMGSERKTKMDEKELQVTAHHEAGHAFIAYISPQSDPIHKITIIPRGNALGMVVRLPERDKFSITRTELISRIKICMGGRAAEEIFFGEENVTTGASNDIEKASDIAKKMVMKWGMSDKLGVQSFFNSQHYDDESDKISPKTRETMDDEIKELLNRLYNEVKQLIIDNKDKVERLAKVVLERETLTGEEVKQVFEGTYTTPSTSNSGLTDMQLSDFTLGGLPSTNLDEVNNDNDNINSQGNDNGKTLTDGENSNTADKNLKTPDNPNVHNNEADDNKTDK